MDSPHPLSPPAPDTVIGGRYRLERRVASGGMASVWEATDEVLARKVAVKILHPHLGVDEQFVARFKREAVAAARLAHPSIVAIYDTCSEGDTEAIVMELVRGTTLRAELDRRGRFDPAEAAEVIAQVADALAAAHGAGLVHRDVKPANVLLSSDGRVLVADFGIAKAADGLDLTGTNTTLGTAKYLAPEQVDASIGPVDPRADVYAAGVMLYELLCGVPPFVADTEAGTAFARLHRDPTRPTESVPDLDPALEAVVLRALARRPDDRFAGAAELRDALRDAARGIPPADGPPTAPVTVVVPDATGVVPVDGTQVVPPLPSSTSAAPAPAHAAAPPAPRRPRRWAPIVLSTIAVVALAVAAVLYAGTGDDPPTNGGATPAGDGGGEEITIAAARSFDPQGDDGAENDDLVGAAVDADPATTWRSSCYSSRDFGNLKDGVGLVLDLSEPRAVDELRVESPTAGWAAEVFVAADAGGDRSAWGEPVATQTSSGGTTTFALEGTEGRYLLLWFTDLGPSPSPDCSRQPFGVSVGGLSVV